MREGHREARVLRRGSSSVALHHQPPAVAPQGAAAAAAAAAPAPAPAPAHLRRNSSIQDSLAAAALAAVPAHSAGSAHGASSSPHSRVIHFSRWQPEGNAAGALSPGDGGANKELRGGAMGALRRVIGQMRRSNRRLPVLLAAIAAAALLVLLALGGNVPGVARPRYDVVLDAGSTGTRVHVYEYTVGGARGDGAVLLLSTRDLKVSPGLSSYASDPDGAAASVAQLLRFAVAHVPVTARKATRVRLMATAGMRLLPEAKQAQLLAACARQLAVSPFAFDVATGARVISGREEALFGWAAVSHALRAAGVEDAARSVAMFEVGGASAQVALVEMVDSGDSGDVLDEDTVSVSLGGVKQDVFVHSFLGLGMDSAHSRVNAHLSAKAAAAGQKTSAHPCLPRGRSESADAGAVSTGPGGTQVSLDGSGDFRACRALVDEVLLATEGCHGSGGREADRTGEVCVAGKQFPSLANAPVVYATENALYTAKYFAKAEYLDGFDEVRCARAFWAVVSAPAMLEEGGSAAAVLTPCCAGEANDSDLFCDRGRGTLRASVVRH